MIPVETELREPCDFMPQTPAPARSNWTFARFACSALVHKVHAIILWLPRKTS